jgi:hypothetical protein
LENHIVSWPARLPRAARSKLPPKDVGRKASG